jgi:hypothetical protein
MGMVNARPTKISAAPEVAGDEDPSGAGIPRSVVGSVDTAAVLAAVPAGDRRRRTPSRCMSVSLVTCPLSSGRRPPIDGRTPDRCRTPFTASRGRK